MALFAASLHLWLTHYCSSWQQCLAVDGRFLLNAKIFFRQNLQPIELKIMTLGLRTIDLESRPGVFNQGCEAAS